MSGDPVHHSDSEKLGLYSSSALRRGAAPVKPALAVGRLSTPSVKLSQQYTDDVSADAVSQWQPTVITPGSPHSTAWHPLHKLILSSCERREKQRSTLSHSWRPTSARNQCRGSGPQSATIEPVLQHPEQPKNLQSPGVSAQVMPVYNQPMHDGPNPSLRAPDENALLSYSRREQVAVSSYCNGHSLVFPGVKVLPEVFSERRSQAGNSMTATEGELVPPVIGANSLPCQMPIPRRQQGSGMRPSLMHIGSRGLTDDSACMPINCDDTRLLSCLHTPLQVGRRCASPTDIISRGRKEFDAAARNSGTEVGKGDCMSSYVISHGDSTNRQPGCVGLMQGAGVSTCQSPEESSEHMPDEEAMSFTDSMSSSRDDNYTSPDIDFFENSDVDTSPADDALTTTVGQPITGSRVISSHPLAINAQSIVSPDWQNSEHSIPSLLHLKSEHTVLKRSSTACDDGFMESAGVPWKHSDNDISSCGSAKASLDSTDRIVDGRRILGNQYVVEKIVGEVCDRDGTCVIPSCHLQRTIDEVFLFRVLMELS